MAVGALRSNAVGLRPAYPSSDMQMALEGRESSSSTWKAGAVLILSSGLLAVASAGAVANIVGVAADNATGVTNAKTRFWPAVPGIIFEGTFENQSTQDASLAQANIYSGYGVHVDSNGIFYVNVNETSNKAVIIVGPRNDADIGNTASLRPRVLVSFIGSTTIWA